MGYKARLDRLLVDRGMAASRARAREMIERGDVLVDGHPVVRPAAQVDTARALTLKSPDHRWVGRGALKLLSVLDPFQVDPAGAVAADLGASTGGFTEVLLQRGAKRVYAIDVGKGLLHYRLRDDPRVVLMEGVNARHLRGLDEPMDLVVGDLSFISIRLILPTVARLLRPQGEAVILVKPQFEVGRKGVARGGRVRNEGLRQEAIASSKRAAEENGMVVLGSADSGLAGGRAGNVEHFLHLRQS